MSRQRSPALAAALSFVLPGLGQVYAGAVRRGLIWAIPTLALLVGAVMLLGGGVDGLIELATNADKLIGLVVLNLAFFLYHVAAMLDAYALVRSGRSWTGGAAVQRGAQGALAGLLVLTLLLHGLPTVAALWGNSVLDRLFPDRSDVIPIVSFEPEPTDDEPSEAPSPTASPTPTQAAAGSPSPSVGPSGSPGPTSSGPPASYPPLATPWGERLDILLIGSDAGPGRTGGRTDTMIVLSVDIATGKAAFFGFPRNKDHVPLPEDASGQPVSNRYFTDPADRLYQGMLSAIWRRAYQDPTSYYTPQGACPAGTPDQTECLRVARAYRATAAAIQNLAGVQIDGIISVNLEAFRELVDAVGGVWIDVPYRIHDEDYPAGDGVSPRVIDIKAGCRHLDGIYALAFARSRHQADDYQRMARQQLVLQAVRRQFDPLAMIPRLPELLDIAAANLYTTFSRDQLGLLAQVAARVDADRMYRVTFGGTSRYPMLLDKTQLKRIRRTVQNIFSQPQPEPTPKPSKAPTCPPAG